MSDRTLTGLAVALALWAAPAVAQQPPPVQEIETTRENPWARGVPPKQREEARALFVEGNKLLKQSIFVKAAEKYTEALGRWNHPAIHYNLALALINLNRPLELYRHLEEAERHGVAPLDAQKLEFVRSYKTLVRQQLAWVEITCEQAGAQVTLDGQPLFVAPGRYEGLVLPGQRVVVATLEGYTPREVKRLLLANESVRLDLKLYTPEELRGYRQLWPTWIPWAVVGSGAVVAAGGGLLHWQVGENFRAYDAGIAACGEEGKIGCQPPAELASRFSLGQTEQGLAIGSYAVGGAALVTGAVLLYLNRPQEYELDPAQLDQRAQGKSPQAQVMVVPLLGNGTGGAVATFRF